MGELKTLRAQQETLVARAKELNHKLFLASVGAFSKAEAESTKLLDKYAAQGTDALGNKAQGKPRALLAARGLADSAVKADYKALAETLSSDARQLLDTLPEKRKALYEQLVETAREERGTSAAATNELVLAGLGAVLTARNKSQHLFNELVSAGSARQG